MSKRKTISQREAVRNRRALRQLRAFVKGISGMYPVGASEYFIASIPCSDAWIKAKMEGASWGAGHQVVFVASATDAAGTISIKAVRLPA